MFMQHLYQTTARHLVLQVKCKSEFGLGVRQICGINLSRRTNLSLGPQLLQKTEACKHNYKGKTACQCRNTGVDTLQQNKDIMLQVSTTPAC